jgi:hypothetical protein
MFAIRRILRISVVLVGTWWLLFSTEMSGASDSGGDIAVTQVRRRVVQIENINGLTEEERTSRLEELRGLAGQARRDWSQRDFNAYSAMIKDITGAIVSRDFGARSRQARIAQELAMDPLKTPDGMGLELETQLVNRLICREDDGGKRLVGEAMTRLRVEQARAWLHGWRRVRNTIDQTWDPDDLPTVNVTPPMGVKGIGLPGIAPAMIENPVLRAEYEAAIETNRRKAERYAEQSTARRLLRSWAPKAQRTIIWLYMDPPAPEGELEGLLREYGVDEATRTTMLEAVKNRKIPEFLTSPAPISQPAREDLLRQLVRESLELQRNTPRALATQARMPEPWPVRAPVTQPVREDLLRQLVRESLELQRNTPRALTTQPAKPKEEAPVE